MEAPKTLRRPANWQDFETLCKKLWGEIWECPEIKKNGRIGQDQHGVDVYGIPFKQESYFGIQCKGKDEYTDKQFTEAEIDKELLKAKTFDPPLKKLYFATTAVKDTRIEEYIRKKNLENIAIGSFEIHIFSWEDIVDLIDENRSTYDWYLKNQNYKICKNISVTFQDATTELTAIPQFKKETRHYNQKIVPTQDAAYPPTIENILNKNRMIRKVMEPPELKSWTQVNLSYFKFALNIRNTGDAPIEELKLLFNIRGSIQDIAKTNVKHTGFYSITNTLNHSDLILYEDFTGGMVQPETKILVSDDNYISDDIFIKPLSEEYNIIIQWKLISRDFKDSGELMIFVRPDMQYHQVIELVENPLEVGIKVGNFEDVIIDKK